MSDFKLTDYAGTYEVLIPAKVELPTGYVDSAGNNVYVLTSRVVMKHIATKVSIIKPHPLHVVICNAGPLFSR
ncbi:hypothetical protein CE629_12690 [Salmonella enterica subsp. enterica serovar Newport]|nr:hypothetical protein [Salmonella enterica subsp. enterica serovar Newport]EDK2033932.1 hypothetical protein [Salmonella enterica subsp. enterica serovar Newport]